MRQGYWEEIRFSPMCDTFATLSYSAGWVSHSAAFLRIKYPLLGLMLLIKSSAMVKYVSSSGSPSVSWVKVRPNIDYFLWTGRMWYSTPVTRSRSVDHCRRLPRKKMRNCVCFSCGGMCMLVWILNKNMSKGSRFGCQNSNIDILLPF